MEISKLNKDDVLSHLGEIITAQQLIIKNLRERVTILFVITGLLIITKLIWNYRTMTNKEMWIEEERLETLETIKTFEKEKDRLIKELYFILHQLKKLKETNNVWLPHTH